MVVGQAVRVDSGLAQVVGRLIFGIKKSRPGSAAIFRTG